MHKKITVLALMFLVVFASTATYASVPYTEDFATDLVKELDIMVGDSEGNMNLSKNLTRAEFTKIAITASKYKNSVAHGAKISVFKDCNYTHWSAPYVKVAVTSGIVSGYPDGTFKPDNLVTYEEAFVVMLQLLGYTSEDFGNTWPYGQVSLGQSLGLGDNISKGIGDVMTRKDALTLVYNTLNAKVKGSQNEYISQLDATLYENVIIIATNNEDTSIAPGSVLTSAGTYRYSGEFNNLFLGTKGSMAVKNNGEIICYTPYNQKNNKLVVYSILSNSVIVYDNGNLTELDVSDNTTVYSGSDKLTFNSAKNQMATGDVIYVVKNSSGAIEYLTLTKDSLRGPETLSSYSSAWYRAFTDDLSTLTVIRNGEKAEKEEVKTYDILYYSKDLNTVFAYSRTITGIYEKAIPNKDTPTSVVISGVEYQIESVKAFDKLSSSGNLSYGSSVTLLFGKDGKIADVISSDDADEAVVGVLVETGKKNFENSDGESYTSRYAVLALPDGSTVEYTTNTDYSNYLNSPVRVRFTEGIAKLTKLSAQNTLSGTADYSAMKIGDYKVSSDVEIIDINTTKNEFGSAFVTTYMSRIDGVFLPFSSVLWFDKNEKGEISKLILNDVTGDSALYGIATSVPSSSDGKSSNTMSQNGGSYRFDVNNRDYNYSGGIYGNIALYSPAKLVVSSTGQIQTISALNKVNGNVSNIKASVLEAGGITYKMSDKVVVYKKVSMGNYNIMPVNDLAENIDDYIVKAYYDKDESRGGRIRIITAEVK